jgi:hypothetical protein
LKAISNSCFTGISSIYGWLPILFATAIISYRLFNWEQIMKTISSFLLELFHQPGLISVVDVLSYIPMTVAILCGLSPVSDDVLAQAGVQLNG